MPPGRRRNADPHPQADPGPGLPPRRVGAEPRRPEDGQHRGHHSPHRELLDGERLLASPSERDHREGGRPEPERAAVDRALRGGRRVGLPDHPEGRRIDGLIVGAEQFGRSSSWSCCSRGSRSSWWGRARSSPTGTWMSTTRRVLQHDATPPPARPPHVVMLAGPEAYPSVQERVEGYRGAMTAAGLEPRAYHCAYHDESATRRIKELLTEEPRPTALFVAAGISSPPPSPRRGISGSPSRPTWPWLRSTTTPTTSTSVRRSLQ